MRQELPGDSHTTVIASQTQSPGAPFFKSCGQSSPAFQPLPQASTYLGTYPCSRPDAPRQPPLSPAAFISLHPSTPSSLDSRDSGPPPPLKPRYLTAGGSDNYLGTLDSPHSPLPPTRPTRYGCLLRLACCVRAGPPQRKARMEARQDLIGEMVSRRRAFVWGQTRPDHR